MKKLLIAGVLGSVLTAAVAFAAERPPVPAKGTEGPDIRVTQPARGTEGPDIR